MKLFKEIVYILIYSCLLYFKFLVFDCCTCVLLKNLNDIFVLSIV